MDNVEETEGSDRPGTSTETAPVAPPVFSNLSAPPIIVKEAALEVIDQLLAKVDHELCCVNQRLKNLEADSSREENKSLLNQSKIPVSQFLPPYFRNNKGYGPPPNEETMLKRQHATFDPLVKVPRPWITREVNFLKSAVREEMINLQLQDVRLQVELLNEKINASGVETSKEERNVWITQKDKLLGIIEYVKTNGSTMPVNPTMINWGKISSKTFKTSRNPIEIRLKWINELDPSVYNGKWTLEETSDLEKLTKGKHGFINWPLVAQQLGTSRRPFAVFQKYQEEIASKMQREWTREEDEKLLGIIEMVRCGDKTPWEKVSQFMVGRTPQQVKNRAKSLDPATRYGRWSEEEDLLLLCSLERYGTHSWDKVSQAVPGRTEAQCKQRWQNHLALAHTAGAQVNTWTLEEDEKLLAGVQIFGRGRWRAISDTLLPARHSTKIRSRYLSLVTTKLRLVQSQAEMVRSSQQALNVRAITQTEKKIRLFDRFIDMTGQNTEVIETIQKQGEEDLEERKKKFTVLITDEERRQAEEKKQQIEAIYCRGVELTETESTEAAERLLEGIVIDQQDLVDLSERLEKRRRVYSGRPCVSGKNCFEIDPKTIHVRAAKRFRKPLKLPNYEPNIVVNSGELEGSLQESRDTLINAIAQRIRLADDYFCQNIITNSDQWKAKMRASFQQVFHKKSDGTFDLIPPNLATLTLQQRLAEKRPKLQKDASLYFPPAQPLEMTVSAHNRVQIQLSRQIETSDEFKRFKARMRALLYGPILLDTSLWSREDEEKWMAMKAVTIMGNDRGESEERNKEANDLNGDRVSTLNERLVERGEEENSPTKSMNHFDIEREASLHRHKIDEVLNNVFELVDDAMSSTRSVDEPMKTVSTTRPQQEVQSSRASVASMDSLMAPLNDLLSTPPLHQNQEQMVEQDSRIPPPAPNPLTRPPTKKKRIG